MRRLPGRMRLPTVPAPSRRMVAGALVTAAVVLPAGLWLRDSPLVTVRHVHVTGISGPQAGQVRQAITDAADGMSTLHVDSGKLQAAVRGFPIVDRVSVHRDLPHTIDVTVREHVPVGALALGGRRVPVAADGTILNGTLTRGLALIPVGAPPGGDRLAERRALRLVALLAAAPARLRNRVRSVGYGPHGLTARISRGPILYFGPGTRLRAKWIAAARVLADYSSKGATYLDLRVPERPAAGGVVATQSQAPPAVPQTPVEPAPTAAAAAATATPAPTQTATPPATAAAPPSANPQP
jgi:cell division protein FtsQ